MDSVLFQVSQKLCVHHKIHYRFFLKNVSLLLLNVVFPLSNIGFPLSNVGFFIVQCWFFHRLMSVFYYLMSDFNFVLFFSSIVQLSSFCCCSISVFCCPIKVFQYTYGFSNFQSRIYIVQCRFCTVRYKFSFVPMLVFHFLLSVSMIQRIFQLFNDGFP